jgi:penicillin-binding protein 1A
VIEPEIIADLNYMLNQVVVNGTGRRAQLGFTPQAGKTGTTQSYRDAWFMGYTGQLVTGVWVGNDDMHEMRRVTGGLLPALTWKAFMDIALAKAEPMALAGVPLDDSYQRVASSEASGDIELPIPVFGTD